MPDAHLTARAEAVRFVKPGSIHPAGMLRSAILLLAFQCAGEFPARAQFSQPAFRVVTELQSGRDARGVFSGDFNGDGRADLGTYGPTQIILHIRAKKGEEWKSIPIPTDAPATAAAVGRFDADSIDDLAILTEHPSGICVYSGNKRSRFKRTWQRALSGNRENMVAADINADGIDDLLLFGSKELGVTLLLGQSNGEFGKDTLLFPEYSVNALKVVDLNLDGLKDFIVSNWISNELLVYSSFGTLKYSEPLSIKVEEGVRSVAEGFIDADANPDIAVLTSRGTSCLIYSGDGFGGFARREEVTLEEPASSFMLADVNNDKKSDVFFLDAPGGGIRMQMGDSAGTFGPPAYLGGGRNPLMMCAFEEGSPRSLSMALLDEEVSTIRLFHNEMTGRAAGRDVLVATGSRPGAIAVADVNHDAHEDLVVANMGSRQLSIYLNRGNDIFGGPIAVPLPEKAVSFAYLRTGDSGGVFITMPQEREKIVATAMRAGSASHQSIVYPLQRPLDILPGGITLSGGGLRVMTMEKKNGADGTLIGLEEIAAGRFVEHLISPPSPSSLVASVARDLNADGIPDLVCLAYDTGGHALRLLQANGNARGGFDSVRAGFSFQVPDSTGARIWLADVNADGVPDCIINIQSPVNELSVSLGRRDTTFSSPSFHFKNAVSISSERNLQVVDLNGDGQGDIIILNDLKREIQLSLGKGNGSFWPSIRVASAEGIGGFAIGNSNADAEPELIMTDSVNSVLRFISLHEQ